MSTRNQQTWDRFCKENPAYSNARTPESTMGNKIYRQQYLDRVDSGEVDYGTALEGTAEIVRQKLAVERLQQNRGKGVEGRADFSIPEDNHIGAKPRLW